jgi:multidrug efflux system membrane fusion protein
MLNLSRPFFLQGMLLAAFCLSVSCTEKKAEAIQREPPPVTVATVERKTVPVEISVIGTVEPYSRVEIKTRVAGQLEQVHFREGQDVKQGDLLFTIDPRRFQTALQEAEANLSREEAMLIQLQANLARDQAEAEFAQSQARRYRKLVDEGISSPEQADQFETSAKVRAEAVEAGKAALDTARAAVQADEAAVRSARVQLGFCTVTSPLTGRTGALLVHEGNIVKENETVLVTINQLTPTYVNFAVPERYLPEIRKQMAARPLRVEARIRSDESQPVAGTLTFIDNAVDETTGTIRLKGTFENSDRRLWPGEFVDTTLRISAQVDVAVAPARSVQTGLDGQFVFVVPPYHVAHLRPVVGGRTSGLDMVIEKGVEPGELVITDGHIRVAPEMKVAVRNE